MTPQDRAAILADLRRQLAEKAPVRPPATPLPSGIPSLDAATGGWPRPGVAAVRGAPGTGRLGLVLPALRALSCADRMVAVVDAMGWLNPPGLPGVRMSRLLLVRPGVGQACWAAEQLASSGAVPLAAVLDAPPFGRASLRLQRAAESGGSTVIVVGEDPGLSSGLTIEMSGARAARVTRGAPGEPVLSLDAQAR